MLLVPPVATFKIVTVLATLFATAASPVSSSAATPIEPVPVVIVPGPGSGCPSSGTMEALLLPLFATTAIFRRGRTATPLGLVPTLTVEPAPVERLINATASHPDKLTTARPAVSCTGSMATPAGSGGVEQPEDTSTLCITVKSDALLTVPSEFSTSSANRRAVDSWGESTLAVSWRLLTNVVVR